jgi:ferritin-like metal-binding protein YciE
MVEKEVLEETIGECLGLERAAQQAVQELNSKELLKEEVKNTISSMHDEAGTHEEKLQRLIEMIRESEGLSPSNIEEHAKETAEKTSQIMKTYLGDEPTELDALEFLSIAEGGEVTHYHVLHKLARGVRNKKFATDVASILSEEKKHMQTCIKLAQQASVGAS